MLNLLAVGPGLRSSTTVAPSGTGGTDWPIVILVFGLLAYGLLQSRASRRDIWTSRWALVVPVLSVVWSDLVYVATSPIRATRSWRASRTTLSDTEISSAIDQMERDLGPWNPDAR